MPWIRTLLAVATMFGAAGVAAETIEYRFEASVEHVTPLPFDVGSDAEHAAAYTRVSGTFSWEVPADVLRNPSATTREYATGMLELNEFAFSGAYGWSVFLSDRLTDPTNPFSVDNFQVRGRVPPVQDHIVLNFVDRSATALSGLDLPTSIHHLPFEAGVLTLTDVTPSGASSVRFRVDLLERVNPDTDGDGVLDAADLCPGTQVPEAAPSSGRLGASRHAFTQPNAAVFTGGRQAKDVFTIHDTRGCSCEQIVARSGLGQGHLKHGCSAGVMQVWVDGG